VNFNLDAFRIEFSATSNFQLHQIGQAVVNDSQSCAPLVAIVTPVYNGEKYLADTMACVQALEYPRLVHVVLDNASTDATPAIISRYSNGRVPLLVARNESTIPIIANFNAALGLIPKEAKYFSLLCADDTMAPNAIMRKVEVAERGPDLGIVGCQCRATNLRGSTLPKDQEIFDGKDVARGMLLSQNDVLQGTEVLVRRSKLDNRVAFYDTAFFGASDTDANFRTCLEGKYGFVHEELATCRQHASNTHRIISQSCLNLADWLLIIDRYGPRVLNDREFQACRKAFLRYYLRRLLLMRWRDGDKAGFAQHLDRLRTRGAAVGWLDFADALVDWAVLAVTGRGVVINGHAARGRLFASLRNSKA
jgi:glycosyltransferase involved in cell wall biosynthesis